MQQKRFRFRIVCRVGGWFGLRAPMWRTSRRNARDAQLFESEVTKWLLDEAVGKWHAGNGKHPGDKTPQAFSTGNAFCVTIERKLDVIRFANVFPIADLDQLHLILGDPNHFR